MQLIAYRTEEHPSGLRPATVRRDWMDDTPSRFAYKCLPLRIANEHGWELTCRFAFDVLWTGGVGPDAIEIVRRSEEPGLMPVSIFGSGVLSLRPGFLFRSDVDVDLYVTGPPNTRKDGIAPLTGIVETSWLPFTFTMNWICTRPGIVVRFERDEPFCFIFPMQRRLLEDVVPVMKELDADPELRTEYQRWRELRVGYREDRARGTPDREARGREPYYMKGTFTDGSPTSASHRTHLNVRPFAASEEQST